MRTHRAMNGSRTLPRKMSSVTLGYKLLRNRNKWSENCGERPHCRRRIFHGGINATLASREQCSRLQQSRWCLLIFAAFATAYSVSQCPSMDRTTFKNSPFHWGSPPPPIMVPWAHQSLPSNQHLDRFSRFCRVHKREQQTDRQTNTLTMLLSL